MLPWSTLASLWTLLTTLACVHTHTTGVPHPTPTQPAAPTTTHARLAPTSAAAGPSLSAVVGPPVDGTSSIWAPLDRWCLLPLTDGRLAPVGMRNAVVCIPDHDGSAEGKTLDDGKENKSEEEHAFPSVDHPHPHKHLLSTSQSPTAWLTEWITAAGGYVLHPRAAPMCASLVHPTPHETLHAAVLGTLAAAATTHGTLHVDRLHVDQLSVDQRLRMLTWLAAAGNPAAVLPTPQHKHLVQQLPLFPCATPGVLIPVAGTFACRRGDVVAVVGDAGVLPAVTQASVVVVDEGWCPGLGGLLEALGVEWLSATRFLGDMVLPCFATLAHDEVGCLLCLSCVMRVC